MKKNLFLVSFFVIVMPTNVFSMEDVSEELEVTNPAGVRKSSCDQGLDEEEIPELPIFVQRCLNLKVYNWFGPANKSRIKVAAKLVLYGIIISYLYNNYSAFYQAFFPPNGGEL
ncbi:MAG: hypothetical protein H0X26_06325 [Alphaproteobacteria bacterium]|nr:hypothetical protein [Alphaproteobacteria bacterium]